VVPVPEHPNMSGTHLTCREVVELVTDYLDDALGDAARDEFERHLVTCEGCRAYLGQMRATVRQGRRLQADEVPAPVMDALLEAFRKG
jgi:anti-sigma factor RsiW